MDSSDEIGEVARAFDQVHQEAVRLAANEAALRGNVNAMFVNLSRRSQSLVERQIRLIDELEQGEQDSKRLASLFQMDHLATRMRRNSENLLVLAGQELSRRWSRPVALVDVLRAAASEIEQYERVTLNVQPGIAVRRAGGQRRGAPDRGAGRERHVVLRGRYPGHARGSPAQGNGWTSCSRSPTRAWAWAPRRWRTRTGGWITRRWWMSRCPGAWACSWWPGWRPGTGSASGSARCPPAA